MGTKEQCIEIYRQAFGEDDAEFREKLFDICFDDCIYIEIDGSAAAMFFALPCEINAGQKLPAVYIYAVATRKDLRSKGYMTQLLKDYISKCGRVVFLRPAGESLTEFYGRIGFKKITAVNSNTGIPRVIPAGCFSELTENMSEGDGKEFTLMYYSKNPQNIDNLKFIYSME